MRKAANLHTGGSIHDVTGEVHPKLVDAACKASRAIDIPVVGIDFIVRSPSRPDLCFHRANERPGLANHEPQPDGGRSSTCLFPLSGQKSAQRALAKRMTRGKSRKLKIDQEYLLAQLKARARDGQPDRLHRQGRASLHRGAGASWPDRPN